jgi:5-methylcytosine-specific restriction enzyme subunit McrC
MARAIPAKNIYYLLLYAWNRMPEGKNVDVTGVASPELPNLLAKVLLDGLRRLQRRGLDRAYIENDEDLNRPRGRMRLGDTVSRALLARSRVACTTDDLLRDVLHNRIIKSTICRLARTAEISSDMREELFASARTLSDIRTIDVTLRDFGLATNHGTNNLYGLLLRICALFHQALIPEPGSGSFRFRDLLADPQTRGLIFQDFVRNFFRLEQKAFAVKGERVEWPVDESYGRGHKLLPTMNTDVSLLNDSRAIIIECKWTGATLQRGRVRSDHLYQLSAYIRHHKRALTSPSAVERLLLYPLVDEPVDVVVRIKDQRVHVRTLDLMCDWPEIHTQLLGVLGEITI